jgi:hypothetical protein
MTTRKQHAGMVPRPTHRRGPHTLLVIEMLVCALPSCTLLRAPEPVHVVDPGSECVRLRTSYPSDYGLLLFADATTERRSIPWCFPAVSGSGVQGYNVQVSVSHAGELSVVLSDITPPTEFALRSVAGTCRVPTGKTIAGHGQGTQWSLSVEPGDHCFSMFKATNVKSDVWLTLTVTRP